MKFIEKYIRIKAKKYYYKPTMTLTMIQVILFLSVAIHLVHCRPIYSRSRIQSDSVPDCTDIAEFNDIFENFWSNISNPTVRLNITVL